MRIYIPVIKSGIDWVELDELWRGFNAVAAEEAAVDLEKIAAVPQVKDSSCRILLANGPLYSAISLSSGNS